MREPPYGLEALQSDNEDRQLFIHRNLMSDYEKYQELGRELKRLGFMEHPKFEQVWREREALKNKYAGHVPPKDCAK